MSVFKHIYIVCLGVFECMHTDIVYGNMCMCL